VPYQGARNSLEGQESIPSVLGPISSSLSGVKHFFKAVLDSAPWNLDPMALRLPWNEGVYQLNKHNRGQNLVFGLLWDDGFIKPHPPVLRAMSEVRDALIASGHKGMILDLECCEFRS
jgi:amidase